MATATKDIKTMTLYVDADFHQAVKVAAAEDRTQITALVEQAVREFLERRRKSRTK